MKGKLLRLAILVISLAGCSKIVEPEFKAIRDFRVKNIGLDAVTIGLGMEYHNPNNFSVTVKETGAKVYLDSSFLGDFIQDTAVAVGSRADFSIPLSATIPLTNFLGLNMKDIHKREVTIRAQGSTKIGKAGVFITKNINYQGRHRLSEIKLQ